MTGPVTLSDLTRDGKLLWCWCADCGREREVDPATVPQPAVYHIGRPQKGYTT